MILEWRWLGDDVRKLWKRGDVYSDRQPFGLDVPTPWLVARTSEGWKVLHEDVADVVHPTLEEAEQFAESTYILESSNET